MKYLLIFFLLAGVASAESFHLKHTESGKLLGPFPWQDGATLKLGTNTYTLVKAKKQLPLSYQLDHIYIPNIEFRNADLRDVVTFLQEASLQNDPNNQGVNIMLMPIKPRVGRDGKMEQPSYPKVTMNIRNVTISDALHLIQSATGWRVQAKRNALLISPPTL